MRYEIYNDRAGEWRWRLRAANNEPIATSGEGYRNKADCLHGVNLVKGSANAQVVEVDG